MKCHNQLSPPCICLFTVGLSFVLFPVHLFVFVQFFVHLHFCSIHFTFCPLLCTVLCSLLCLHLFHIVSVSLFTSLATCLLCVHFLVHFHDDCFLFTPLCLILPTLTNPSSTFSNSLVTSLSTFACSLFCPHYLFLHPIFCSLRCPLCPLLFHFLDPHFFVQKCPLAVVASCDHHVKLCSLPPDGSTL